MTAAEWRLWRRRREAAGGALTVTDFVCASFAWRRERGTIVEIVADDKKKQCRLPAEAQACRGPARTRDMQNHGR